jgi:hypothetical protein
MLSRILPRNESTADRILRVTAGVAILSLAFIGPQTPWAFLGIIPIVTGALGSCPLYTVLGVGTCAVPDRSR